MASVFTKIINNEIPAYRLFEDDLVIAILTIEPIQLGHALVIPKQEVNHWDDVPLATMTRVQDIAQKISKAIKKSTDCSRVLSAAIGFEVHHYHLHLIPAWSMADLDFKKAGKKTDIEMRQIQEKIISNLDI